MRSERNDDVRMLESRIEELEAALVSLSRDRSERWKARAMALIRNAWVRRAIVLGVFALPLAAYSVGVTIPYVFVNGQIADADEVNANFTALNDGLMTHELDPSVHHLKTTDAAELATGTLDTARLPATVSLLGLDVSVSELDFDPATQTELDDVAADPLLHHLRYTDAEAVLAVGPHTPPTTSVDGLSGGTISSEVRVAGLVSSTSVGFRFPDASIQTTAAQTRPNHLVVAAVGGDFTSIQAALGAISPSAANPYLIEIAAGVYIEDIKLKDYVHLRGAGRGSTIIEGAGGRMVVSLSALSGVRMSELTVSSPSSSTHYGIDVDGSELELDSVSIEGPYDQRALLAHPGSTVSIRESLVENQFGEAMELRESDSMIVSSVIRPSIDCGIKISGSGLHRIRGNRFEVGPYALCEGAGGAGTAEVFFSDNHATGANLAGSMRARFTGNHFTYRVWVEVDHHDQVLMSSNTYTDRLVIVGGDVGIVGNTFIGAYVDLGSLTRAEVIGNRFEGSCFAAGCIRSKGTAQIIGNQIEGGGVGVVDDGDSVIVGNRMSSMTINSLTSTVLANSVAGVVTGPGGRVVTNGGISLESQNDAVTFTAGGSSVTLGSNGDITINAAGDMTVQTGGNMTMQTGGNIDLVGQDVTIQATGRLQMEGANVDLAAAGILDVVGTLINLN